MRLNCDPRSNNAMQLVFSFWKPDTTAFTGDKITCDIGWLIMATDVYSSSLLDSFCL